MLSDRPEASAKLDALLNEALAQPTAKLVANAANSVQTTKIRVPGRWVAPPSSALAAASTSQAAALKSSGLSASSSAYKVPPQPATKELPAMPMPRAAAAAALAAKKTIEATPFAAAVRPFAPWSSSAPGAGAASAGSKQGRFCVCKRLDDDPDQTFVRCTVGKGGCNGWVHAAPACSGLTEDQLDDLVLSKKQPQKYVCRLCRALKATATAATHASTGHASSDKAEASEAGGGEEWMPEKATPAKRGFAERPPMERSTSSSSARENLLKKISKGRR
jgi:hypothetical protein